VLLDGVEVNLEAVRLLPDEEDGAGQGGEGAGHVRNSYNCDVRMLEQIMNMSNLKLRNNQYLLGFCLMSVSLRLGLVPRVCHLVLMRIPGRSSGVPMNSMPATSRAFLMASMVLIDALGPFPSASKRRMVFSDSPALEARSCSESPRAARAILICSPLIIDTIQIVRYLDNYGCRKKPKLRLDKSVRATSGRICPVDD